MHYDSWREEKLQILVYINIGYHQTSGDERKKIKKRGNFLKQSSATEISSKE